jgi:hypothetical protein
MRKGRLFVGAAILSALTSSAHAGFTFNYTVSPGIGALAGKNVFKFYATNDQTGEQAGSKGFIAAQVTFQSLGGPLAFEMTDVDNDGIDDANIDGEGMSETDVRGTFLRIESDVAATSSSWFRAAYTPNGAFSLSGGNPSATYAALTQFSTEGVELRNANKGWVDATQGLGRFFAAAVVPADTDTVKLTGRVAAEVGGIVSTSSPMPGGEIEYPESGGSDGETLDGPVGAAPDEPLKYVNFSITATVPEPATAGLIVAAVAAGLMRRRAAR